MTEIPPVLVSLDQIHAEFPAMTKAVHVILSDRCVRWQCG